MSEIARLRRQIELECEAAKRGLEGLAVVANHDSINARMGKLWEYRQELAKEVGEQEATKIITVTLTNAANHIVYLFSSFTGWASVKFPNLPSIHSIVR